MYSTIGCPLERTSRTYMNIESDSKVAPHVRQLDDLCEILFLWITVLGSLDSMALFMHVSDV